MDIHEIHAKMLKDRRPAPVTGRALWTTLPPVLRMALLLALQFGLWTAIPAGIESFFSPDPPDALMGISRDDIHAAVSSGGFASDVAPGVEQLLRDERGPAQVGSGPPPDQVTHAEIELASYYARTITRIRDRARDLAIIAYLIFASIALCFVGYRWHDIAFFAFPFLNIMLFFRLTWRLASLPDRPWAEAPPPDPA